MAMLCLPDADLLDFAASCVDDPLRFVLAAFPWGEPGTLLAHETGPDTWQMAVLEEMRVHIQTSTVAFRKAVASGHGVGKSALTSWIILWFLATHPHPQAVVTANTGTQLNTKTWRELAKWLQLSLYAETFAWTATKCYHRQHPATWFVAAVPWRADRPEAFAGTHEKHVLVIKDEASAIDDIIWENVEGAMTTPSAFWLAFANPTRNSGRSKSASRAGALRIAGVPRRSIAARPKWPIRRRLRSGSPTTARTRTLCACASRAHSLARPWGSLSVTPTWTRPVAVRRSRTRWRPPSLAWTWPALAMIAALFSSGVAGRFSNVRRTANSIRSA